MVEESVETSDDIASLVAHLQQESSIIHHTSSSLLERLNVNIVQFFNIDFVILSPIIGDDICEFRSEAVLTMMSNADSVTADDIRKIDINLNQR